MNVLNEIEDILVYQKVVYEAILLKWKKETEIIVSRQEEEIERLRRAFNLVQVIETPKMKLVQYVLRHENNDYLLDKERITMLEVCIAVYLHIGRYILLTKKSKLETNLYII